MDTLREMMAINTASAHRTSVDHAKKWILSGVLSAKVGSIKESTARPSEFDLFADQLIVELNS